MSDTKKRIARGERVTWRTNLGSEHAGEVVTFVPAHVLVIGHIPESARKSDCKWAPAQDISPMDRYLVKNEEATLASYDAPLTDRRVIYRVPNATTLEKANPTAKREP